MWINFLLFNAGFVFGIILVSLLSANKSKYTEEDIFKSYKDGYEEGFDDGYELKQRHTR